MTLPWQEPAGELVTARLIVYSRERTAAWRPVFNQWTWKQALARAGVPSARENGVHALRHFYPSTLLDAGETITALAAYLGHSDPAFTLARVHPPHAVQRRAHPAGRRWGVWAGVAER